MMVRRKQADTPIVLEKFPITPPSRSAREKERTFVSKADDVIQSLSGAYENQRARQVGEWERVQSHAVRHLA